MQRKVPVMTNAPDARTGFPPPADLTAQRAAIDAAVTAGIWHTAHRPSETVINGVRCLVFEPAADEKGEIRGCVVHFHGGGFRLGCPEQVAPFAALLCARARVKVVCPAYRLAPEHPFPAALCDARSVIEDLIEAGERRIVLTGDSAGGAIAAAIAASSDRFPVRPACLVLLSPWLDLSVSAPSFTSNAASDALFSNEAARAAAALYLQGVSPHDPQASPLLGPAASFPPTLINAGTGEVLVDDARRMAAHLSRAGISCHLHLVDGMEHVAVTRSSALPGSAETFERIAAFLDQTLSHVS